MSKFQIQARQSATEATKEVLDKAEVRYGFVPNLIGALSVAPAAADIYMQMGTALSKGGFAPAELHVAWFTVNAYHGCEYCMAAHSGMATMQKIPADVIETARSGGDYADPKLQALKVFTIAMLDQRGWAKPEEIDAFLAAGFTQAHVIELILLIAHKTLSNYTNHVVETPVDDKFAPFAWSRAVAAE